MSERAVVTYHGEHPVDLHPMIGSPFPASVQPGGSFEIDADVADTLDDRFAVEGPPEELTAEQRHARDLEARPEPIPVDELRAAVEVEPEELRGRELDEQLRAAGLSTSGTLAARRERLAEWQAAQTGTASTDTETGA